MMSLDRYMGKFFYLAVFSCLLVTAFMVGCGSGNNPSGVGVAPEPAVTEPTEEQTWSVAGILTNAITGNLVSENENISATFSEIGSDKAPTTLKIPVFKVADLEKGYYKVDIAESTNFFADSKTFEINASSPATLELTFSLIPRNVAANATMDYFGKIVDAATGKGIQYANVKATNSTGYSYDSTTLLDGSFLLRQLASGTYTISVSKSGFDTATRDLNILENSLTFGTFVVSDIAGKSLTEAQIVDPADPNYEEQLSKIRNLIDNPLIDLGKVLIAPQIENTGALAGVLIDRTTGKPFADTVTFDLIFDSNLDDDKGPTRIISGFRTVNGYFMIKNLSGGWYTICRSGTAFFSAPKKDSSGNVVGYVLVDAAEWALFQAGTDVAALQNIFNTQPNDFPVSFWSNVTEGVTTILPAMDYSDNEL